MDIQKLAILIQIYIQKHFHIRKSLQQKSFPIFNKLLQHNKRMSHWLKLRTFPPQNKKKTYLYTFLLYLYHELRQRDISFAVEI